jgi:hypothetical protein
MVEPSWAQPTIGVDGTTMAWLDPGVLKTGASIAMDYFSVVAG